MDNGIDLQRYREASRCAMQAASDSAQSAAEYAVANAIRALEVVRIARVNGDWVNASDALLRTVHAASHAVSSATIAAKALDDYDKHLSTLT